MRGMSIHRRMVLLLWMIVVLGVCASTTSEMNTTVCSLDSPVGEFLLIHVGGSADETTLQGRGGCEAVADSTTINEEDCLCATFRLGWYEAARVGLRRRLLRKQPVLALRKLAQYTIAQSQVVLAQLHPRYPRHLKFLPAIEWAQTEEILSVKVRHARYTRGDPIFTEVGACDVRLSDLNLYYAAEGACALHVQQRKQHLHGQ